MVANEGDIDDSATENACVAECVSDSGHLGLSGVGRVSSIEPRPGHGGAAITHTWRHFVISLRQQGSGASSPIGIYHSDALSPDGALAGKASEFADRYQTDFK